MTAIQQRRGSTRPAMLTTSLATMTACPARFDDELLDAHFATGDGRGNENIGLTAVHTIFHAEHNRLVGAIQSEVRAILAADGISDFVRGWVLRLPGETDAQFDARILDGITDAEFDGERVFQGARVFTEMQYQHLCSRSSRGRFSRASMSSSTSI